MRLAPVEAERNIKSVVANNINDAIILIVLFTRSGINDYNIYKIIIDALLISGLILLKLKGSDQILQGANHGK